MMEIERKFLVATEGKLPVGTPVRITQGYLNQDPERTVRIRIAGNDGYITVKGKSSDDGLSRYEWEKKIAIFDALVMMQMCTGIIDKSRYHIQHAGKVWELDVFHGLNAGLVVAEIELKSVDEPITLPPWVTKEVTGDPKYYNSNLINHPYKAWAKPECHWACTGCDKCGSKGHGDSWF